MFDKKNYKKEGLSKNHKTHNIEILTREANNLAKFKHPAILKILEPVYEDSNSIGFITEPVECTLRDIFEKKSEKEIRENIVELKFNLIQLIDAIRFLHEQARSVHLNICPENIVVTKMGEWKLIGLGFLT